MKTKQSVGISRCWGLLAFTCLIASIALIISLMLPYESRGGAMPGEIALKEESLNPDLFQNLRALKLTQLRVKVATLTVDIEDDHYVGEAQLLMQGEVDLVDNTCIAIIPAARVQRIFELAFMRTTDLVVWGYKTPAPEGHPYKNYPFYTVVKASIWDPKIIAYTIPVEEG